MTPFSFFNSPKQYISSRQTFGLCDKEPPPHLPAYLDENNGKDWIAVAENFYQNSIKFVALDNCITLSRTDGKQDKCCDGMLLYNSTIIFVELTTRTDDPEWRKEKYKQLCATIKHCERTEEANTYKIKKAYIANSSRPKFKAGYGTLINRFLTETGYVLRIQNRIEIV
ncbi:MAG: hypothetical protein LBU90_02250 [Bacteroidales bacterium]|jgi:hypothetical protein|nr:hypothetical protein [Bacteroidales bacterium]